jgi:hypothetical protein
MTLRSKLPTILADDANQNNDLQDGKAPLEKQVT